MESQPLTEYEQKRLENIGRNGEMVAALKLQSKSLELSSAAKRQRVEAKGMGFKTTLQKKPKPQTPIVVRSSLRTRGLPPEQTHANDLEDDTHKPKHPYDVSMKEALRGPDSNRILVDTILGMAVHAPLMGKRGLVGNEASLDLGSMVLRQENISPSMESQQLTEYERKRLENIRRNGEMVAALKLQSKALQLSSAAKRQRVEAKGYKTTLQKKPKPQTPIVVRSSLRTRGLPPELTPANDLEDNTPKPKYPDAPPPITSVRKLYDVSMKEALRGPDSDRVLVDTILGMAPLMGKRGLVGNEGSLDFRSMSLHPENIARVMPGKIMSVEFFPCNDRNVIVAGNRYGDIAFWDVDCKEGKSEGIYLYQPHSASVSGISIQPFSLSKVVSSDYDGLVRLLDFEKESFDLVYSCDDPIFALSHQPQVANSLFFSDGRGLLNAWDLRVGKASSSWMLHDARINSIHFNPENTNLMVTSSSDGTVCIWDLRQIDASKPKNLKTLEHKKSIHAAYFSPSGSCVATTSFDAHVGIVSGADFGNTCMVHHNNQTGRWISPFRAIWGWDDSYIFTGSMNRGVDVISVAGRKTEMTLHNPDMSEISCRFAAHQYKVGTLAATTSGQIYVWTQSW